MSLMALNAVGRSVRLGGACCSTGPVAQEAGGEADVPAHGVLHEAPHDGLRLGAGPVVEVEGQARGQRRLPRVAVAVRRSSR